MRRQDGVLGRTQLAAAGIRPDVGREQVLVGRWQRILPGYYLTNTGRITFRQKCWAAVLHAGHGAAITGAASAYLDRVITDQPDQIEVAVPHGARVSSRAEWLVIRQVRNGFVIPSRRPPQTTMQFAALVRTEHAATEDEVIAILTETARAAGTADHLSTEAGRWRRLRWRSVVEAVLAPDEAGHESILEWSFTHRVLRAHGLPEPRRQAWLRMGPRQIRVDGLSFEWGIRFELDGRIHEGKTEDDIWRDNEATVSHGQPTLRFRWRHITGRPCASALLVARGYRSRGWPGRARPCGPGCPVGRTAD